jgi:fructokinase
MSLYGAIEGGGTKFICGVGRGPDEIEVSPPILTREPEETLRDVIGFFAGRRLKRLGIACFGPLDLRRGVISKVTPKAAWRGVPIAKILGRALEVETVIDTDVNAAAIAEHRWGAGQGIDNLVYLTVGTGIGGGAIVNGKLVHGLLHPEMGHLRIAGIGQRGVCPFHEDCWEGYACGPAVQALGSEQLPRVIASGLGAIAATISPELFILGGGVMKTRGLLAAIRKEVRREPYLRIGRITKPALGDRAGVLGALALALDRRR